MTDPESTEQSPEFQEWLANVIADLERDGFALNGWWVEPRRNLISTANSEQQLDPRVMQVLVHLAARAGSVVSREELSAGVWNGTFVGENTVSQAVSRLRRALGDDSQKPRYIETISKSGYRLIANVMYATTDGSVPGQAVAEVHGYRRGKLIGMIVTFILIGMALFEWLSDDFGSDTENASAITRVVPELTFKGNQFEPTLSPHGDRVAFCWKADTSHGWSIWVQTVGGDQAVRLTDKSTNERLPAWAPDGRSLAYVQFNEAGLPGGIFRSDLLNKNAEHLADCGPGIGSIHWSPDGKTLAMAIRVSDEGPYRIDLLDIESGDTRELTTVHAGIIGHRGAVFSPDGSQLAFEHRISPAKHDVTIVDVATGDITKLTDDAWGRIRGLDWRSDGEAILYSSNRTGTYSLWQVATTGGEPTQLPIHDTWVTQPSVARSGGRLTYRTFRDVVNIWAIPLTPDGAVASAPAQMVPSTRSERQPALNNAGSALAFISDRSGTNELWSARSDGSGMLRHTSFRGAIPGAPGWSPDGTNLIFEASPNGNSDLFTIRPDSRQPERITSGPKEERNGVFSRDGKSIYFAWDNTGSWEIWRMRVAGGPSRQLTTTGGFYAQESQDGEHLYFTKLEEPGLWRMPVDGGEPQLVVAELDLSDWGNWVVAPNGIYLVTRGPTAIQYLDFDDGSVRQLTNAPGQIPFYERSLSMAADGQKLIVAVIESSDDEVMRVDMAGL